MGTNYLAQDWKQELITLEEFIDKYILHSEEDSHDNNNNNNKTPIGYLAQTPLFDQIPELREGEKKKKFNLKFITSDICVPDYCAFGEEEPTINAWFGPAGKKKNFKWKNRKKIFRSAKKKFLNFFF